MFILGDIHGNFNQIVNFCRRNESKQPINLIQLGDFGAGFSPDFLDDMEYLNEYLFEHNVTLYVIRGNHDDPKFFNGNYNWSNLKLLKDYTVLDLEGKKILLIGGATSIDRNSRTENISWWSDEIFHLDVQKIKELKNIDIVITHTAPNFVNPVSFNSLVLFFAKYDINLLRDLEDERNNVKIIYDILSENNKIEQWFYGHFHDTSTEEHNNTTFDLLGINEFYYLN
jgi:predicted phosphodiesterase